jgi:hypothetical protein
MDSARCRCLQDPAGQRVGCNPACPIHGTSGADPIKPYRLSEADRQLLHSFRIAVADSAEIQQVRQAEEDRFRRD